LAPNANYCYDPEFHVARVAKWSHLTTSQLASDGGHAWMLRQPARANGGTLAYAGTALELVSYTVPAETYLPPGVTGHC
jgi:hypothetical protein